LPVILLLFLLDFRRLNSHDAFNLAVGLFIMTLSCSRLGKLAVCGLISGACLVSTGVRAGSVFFQFDDVFAGTSPTGSGPWVDATFSDLSSGVVQLTITAEGLTGGESLSDLFFNFNPGLNPGKLSFKEVSSTGSFAVPSISEGANAFKADDQGKYDVYFAFSQKTAKEFDGNDSVTYDITSSAFTLDAADFAALSTASGGCDQLLAAAEIMGIPTDCPGGTTDTGWIAPSGITPTPEPRTISLLLCAFSACFVARYFRNRFHRA
jgi:hypothetical protein